MSSKPKSPRIVRATKAAPTRRAAAAKKTASTGKSAAKSSAKAKPKPGTKGGKSAAGAKAARSRAPARRRRSGGSGGRGLLGLPLRVLRGLLRLIWRVTWRVGAVAVLVLGITVAVITSTLPPAAELLDGRTRGSVTLLDRTGEVFAWRGDQFGGGIDAATVSPHLRNAIIATEDRRYYRHFGVDPLGIVGAMRINLSEGRGPLQGHGGSTITQQTAKLLCIGQPYDPASGESEAAYEARCRAGTLERKAREALYALGMEAKYSKDEILTIYMNRAYLGAGTRGFEAASQRYFGKSAQALGPAEAAMLAGLLVAPSRFAPTADLARSQARAEVIVGLMEAQGYLTAAEAQAARAAPATLSQAAAARTGSYFADWLVSDARQVPEFWGARTTEDVVLHTTLDVDIQRAAEAALAEVFAEKVRAGSEAEAAIVVMSADGAVRAMVGGRQADVPGGFNRAVQAQRQTGSAFKPFVYATALELGYAMTDRVEDAPLTLQVPGSGPWSPQNYTRTFRGPVTLTEALQWSLNIPAVKVSEAVGRDLVRQVAQDFGIESDLDVGPALALGTSEASLLEMTAAYAGILNGGRSVMPYGLTELRLFGEGAPEIVGQDGLGERVIAQSAARQLVYMLHEVVEAGTGTRAQVPGHPVAGKTGTTQAARDAWFVGFTGAYVAGVWMGYDDNTPLTGVTGGGLPAEIWAAAMGRIHEGRAAVPLPMTGPGDAPVRVVTGQGSAAEERPTPVPASAGGGQSAPSLAQRILDDMRGLFGRN